jgi:Putative DNA-binding domain
MGTENDERFQFSLKNLKVIRNYIENGVFSLAETKEDKLARELEEKRIYWEGRINQDEGENLEFKSTLITPVPDSEKLKIIQKLEKELESVDDERKKGIKVKIDELKGDTAQKRITHSAFKTISAFANTNGGVLLIGVSNDKSIYGLEKDYQYFKKESEQNRDGFGKFLDSKLKSYFGDSFSSQYLKKDFLNFPEGDILIIEVKESLEEIFLLRDENDNISPGLLYVRNLSSTDKLEGIELAKFIKQRTSQRNAIAK